MIKFGHLSVSKASPVIEDAKCQSKDLTKSFNR